MALSTVDRAVEAQAGQTLAQALASDGRFERCAKVAESVLKDRGPDLGLFILGASCHVRAGDLHRAASLLRKGRREFPEDPELAYDAAEVEVRLRDWGEARMLLKIAIAGRPRHAASHLLLGRVYRSEDYLVPSVVTYLRYLSLEPEGAEAQEAAQRVADFLLSGASRGAEGQVEVKVNPNRPKDEGDFAPIELLLALSAGAHLAGQAPLKPEIGTLVEQLGQLLAVLAEAPQRKGKATFVAEAYIPVFAKLTRAGLAEPFGYLAFAPLGLAGTDEWLRDHRETLDRLKVWLAAN
jgi:tetratricopeptide (TPR) repeat protein